MSKSYQVARAAASGIEAARLAEAGMTGAPDAIEHHAGLLSAMSVEGDADLADPTAPIGKTLRILEQKLSFKKYPVCYCAHRVIDAVIDIANAADLQPSAVDSVDVRIGATQHSMLRNDRPKTGLEAKFSIEFAIAAGLVSRSVGLSELETGYVNRADIQQLLTKVNVSDDDSVCPVEPAFSMNDRLVIKLKDGRVMDSGDIRFSRGHAMMPLAPGELQRKFLDCCRGANDLDAQALFDRLATLEKLPDMGMLSQG
jgi:aconitate decarboxylase